MLVIRAAQLDALAEARLHGFRPWMLDHLRSHFGARLWERSDDELSVLIDEGIGRGRAYGVETLPSLCKFIDLHVLFGAGFEDNRDHVWVRRALAGPPGVTPDARVGMMIEHAVAWLDQAEHLRAWTG